MFFRIVALHDLARVPVRIALHFFFSTNIMQTSESRAAATYMFYLFASVCIDFEISFVTASYLCVLRRAHRERNLATFHVIDSTMI